VKKKQPGKKEETLPKKPSPEKNITPTRNARITLLLPNEEKR